MDDLRILKPKRWLVTSGERALFEQVRDALSKVEPDTAPLAAWRLKFGLLKMVETNVLEREIRECLRDQGTGLRVYADVEPVRFDRLIESAVEPGEEFRVGFSRLSADSLTDFLDGLSEPDAWVMLAWIMSGRRTVPRLPCDPACDDEHAEAFRKWAYAYEQALGPDGLAAVDEAIGPDDEFQSDQAAAAGSDWRSLDLPNYEEGHYVTPERPPELMAAETNEGAAREVPLVTWHGPTFQVKLLSHVGRDSYSTALKMELRRPDIAAKGQDEVWLRPYLRPVIKVRMPAFKSCGDGFSFAESELSQGPGDDIHALVKALTGRTVSVHRVEPASNR